MQRLSKRTLTALATMALALVEVLLVVGSGLAASKATTLTIWTDADRKAAVDKIASAWGSSRGVNVVVAPVPNIPHGKL